MAVFNRSWRVRLGGLEHITKVGVGEGREKKGYRTKRDRGSWRGKGKERGSQKTRDEGEGEERGSRESKLAPSPLPYTVPYHVILKHIWQCF